MGAEVSFKSETGDEIKVFTTRPDTLFGATYMVLAPEHPLLGQDDDAAQKDAVAAYAVAAGNKSDLERTELQKGQDRRVHRRLRGEPRQRR